MGVKVNVFFPPQSAPWLELFVVVCVRRTYLATSEFFSRTGHIQACRCYSLTQCWASFKSDRQERKLSLVCV